MQIKQMSNFTFNRLVTRIDVKSIIVRMNLLYLFNNYILIYFYRQLIYFGGFWRFGAF